MTRLAIVLLVVATACGNTTDTAPTALNLNRPVDISFACYGGLRITNGAAPDPTQTIETTAQPIEGCDVRAQEPGSGSGSGSAGTRPVPPGQEDLTAMGGQVIPAVQYYAFILQPAVGTVVVASFDSKPPSQFIGGDLTVLDSDPLTPGNNGVSVGEDPVAIATDREGCYEVVANAGSCDMTAVDVSSVLDTDPSLNVNRFNVTTANGQPLRAKPAAMAFEPPSGTIGVDCPAQPTGIAYVAYPSCHLVAAIDTSTGAVVKGIQFDATGTPQVVDGNLSCPDECGGTSTVTPGIRPVTLDLELDPRSSRRVLLIGADNSSAMTIVELGLDYLPSATPTQLALQDPTGKLGITDIALSPQIGMGGTTGVINDDTSANQFQFAYAVTTDGSVRVADILNLRRECDTQVDPRFLHDVKNVKQLSCLPVGDPLTPPRRAGARGPGIELIGHGVATSVDVFRVDGTVDPLNPQPAKFVGYYGVISAANGAVYVFNVDDDGFADDVNTSSPLSTPIPLDIAHQLRDGIPDRGLLAQEDLNGTEQPICDTSGPDPDSSTGNDGGPRATDQSTRVVPDGVFAAAKVGSLPSIRQVRCTGVDEPTGKPVPENTFAAPTAVREAVFPDLRGLRADEIWTLTFEGSLSVDTALTAIDGPEIRESQIAVDAASMQLQDGTRPFCDAGVEPFDIVQLRGCDPSLGDADCPLGYTCYVHPDSQVAGLGACMLTSEADRLANACREFLISLRRYTIGKSTSGALVLLPRKHELLTSPVDGCTSDAQCQTLANYSLTLVDASHPVDDKTPADTHTWSCMADPDRAPMLAPSTGKRCIETCAVDTDCVSGTVCSNGICMEGVEPPQACVNAPQRYELRAGEAFSVLGASSGYIHPIIADANGNCIRDPNAPPTQIGRIPLRALPCDPTADPRTGQRPDGTFEPNPCQLTTTETEQDANYVTGTCTTGSPASTLVDRTNAPAIQFRNPGMTITLVDPIYPGDATCIGDRGANLGNMPVTPQGYQMSFRQTAGFSPLTLGIQPSYPVKVTRGPGESIWVVDEGDFLSTTITEASTRGKVFRIESSAITIINLLE